MPEDKTLLTRLEAFVDAAVDLDGFGSPGDPLRAKLDVLERVVELLRIRSGWGTRRVRVGELLDAGIAVEVHQFGNAALHIGHGDRKAMWDWPVVSERKEMELQAALLVYLLHYHRAGTRIGSLLAEFANLIRDQLSPADAETTETGVTRIMTTIRSAARTLRLYGLLTESQRVAYRTWELSVFGILVAVRLHESGQRLTLPERRPFRHSPGPSGAQFVLADRVMATVRELSAPGAVVSTLERVCEPNIDVFDSFGPVIDTVRDFCEQIDRLGGAEKPQIGVLRKQAEAMMKAVADAVPPAVLAEDLAKHFALEGVIAS